MHKNSWKSFSRTETGGRETCPANSHRSLTRSVRAWPSSKLLFQQTPCPDPPELAGMTQGNSWLTWSLGLVKRTVSKEQALGVRQHRKHKLNLESNLACNLWIFRVMYAGLHLYSYTGFCNVKCKPMDNNWTVSAWRNILKFLKLYYTASLFVSFPLYSIFSELCVSWIFSHLLTISLNCCSILVKELLNFMFH